MPYQKIAPATWLSGAVLLCLLSVALCAALTLSPPWLGISLNRTAEGPHIPVVAVAPDGPSAGQVAPGDQLVALEAGGTRVALAPVDAVEEPDFLKTWAEVNAFRAKQDSIATLLNSPAVTLHLQTAAGARAVSVAPQQRPLSSLPHTFWLQLFFGVGGCLIGIWVLTLRPNDWGVRMYALTGTMFPVFAHAAAIYSSRELAMGSPLFAILASVNFAGAILFGGALCGIFLMYPRPLVRPRTLGIVFGVIALWMIAAIAQIIPDPGTGMHLPILVEMLGAIALALVQWWRVKGDPVGRATLRWFAFWVLLGSGLFVGLTTTSARLTGLPPMQQSYAFGFFLLMYTGLAFGLRKYRIFDLDRWALRILFWTVAVVSLIALDVTLITLTQMGHSRSLSITLLVALLYIPLRHWLWDRAFRRSTMSQEELFDEVLHVGFEQSDDERITRWRALLTRMFDPLHIEHMPIPPANVTLGPDGLTLEIPAVASSPALRLSHPWSGRKLFGPHHVKLASTIVQLMRSADESRSAFQQGVLRERTRIARDLHDDVSSPLLAELSRASDDRMQDDIRKALTQMRSIVTGVDAQPAPLTDCLADIRFAAVERLSLHNIQVEWPAPEESPHVLSPVQRKALTSLHHEIVTNIIKHADASVVRAHVSIEDDALISSITDDGVGFDLSTARQGQGLPNLQSRAQDLGGTITIEQGDNQCGTNIHLYVPLSRAC